jgi:predicted nucleic acid-binding protein
VNGFLLDTNVLSEFKRRGEPDPHVRDWLRATDPDLLWASVLSFGEIRKGIERIPAGKRRSELEQWFERDLVEWFEERLLPVTKAVAERWGILSARNLDKGTPLPNIDGLIAATALESDLTLVTRNIKDFAGLEVTIVNPWEGEG